MSLAKELEALIRQNEPIRFGEIMLHQDERGSYLACHQADYDAPENLEAINSYAELREVAKFAADGAYRPLKTTPGLKRGWKTETSCAAEFLKRLDCLYPGVCATWIAYARGELRPVALRETLERQTGMYGRAREITDQMANQIMRETCAGSCLRKIAWSIDDQAPLSQLKKPPRTLPMICTEACTFAVDAARKLAKSVDR